MLNVKSPILDRKNSTLKMINRWVARGWLRGLDAVFAEFLWHEVPDAPPLLIVAATLASHQLGRGHACLDLEATLQNPAFALSLPPDDCEADTSEEPLLLPADVLAGVTLTEWLAALQHPLLVGSGVGNTPLVCVGDRLYLRRYWHYEQAVRAGIQQRLIQAAPAWNELTMATLRQTLTQLFPPSFSPSGEDEKTEHRATNWQKLACVLAARSAFSIITGGPGTGKTTTVVRLLALLQAMKLTVVEGSEAKPLRIRLAAPTGKAAARLNESIAGAVSQLPFASLNQGEAIRAAIPLKVTTLHRLLGSRPDTRHFRYHAGNPLALDVLVVDEASMVDLEMMASVLAALPRTARLILLGDKDQLASVEAGAVLGELCQRARGGHYTPATAEWLFAATGERIEARLMDDNGTALDQAVSMLRQSYRFTANSGIGRLAEAVNEGNASATAAIWQQGYADLTLLLLDSVEDPFKLLVNGYRHYLETLSQKKPAWQAEASDFNAWAQAVLQAHGDFQVLCALRRGPWGVEGLNQTIATLLYEAGLIPAIEGWYLGRPVLVTRNDYSLGLMNGDIGITLELPGADQTWNLRVAFPSGDGGNAIRWVLPSRLQAVETVYALTIHKSQGSEFAHAAMVLPNTPNLALNPILTRELIYTGITRARSHFTLAQAGSLSTLMQAVQRRVLRDSGLMR